MENTSYRYVRLRAYFLLNSCFWQTFQILKNGRFSRKNYPVPKKHSFRKRQALGQADQNKLELNHSLYSESEIPSNVLRCLLAAGAGGFGGLSNLPFSENGAKKYLSLSTEKRTRLLKTECDQKIGSKKKLGRISRVEKCVYTDFEQNKNTNRKGLYLKRDISNQLWMWLLT